LTPTSNQRLASIDIFRGLTMALMIFVNSLAAIHHLPWWNYHAPAMANAITYPDLVFPFFLFAVGLSLPLALGARIQKGDSTLSLWRHLIERSANLVILGLILANADLCDPHRTGLSSAAWALAALLSAALVLHIPSSSQRLRPLSRSLRILGYLLLAILLLIFRRSVNGHAVWFDFAYPEILGLIGFTYFGCSLLYLPTRRHPRLQPLWAILLLALSVAVALKWWEFDPPLFLWPFGTGTLCFILFAGILTTEALQAATDQRRLLLQLSGIAIGLLALAALLLPLGLSKIRATPSWALISVGLALILFLLLHWLCDLRGHTRWALPVQAAGSNTLLTYLLPDLLAYILAFTSITFYDEHMTSGLPGLFKCLLFTAAVLALATLLTRLKIRLKL